ncbi:MAG: uracil-DNA glycosylase, partial [Dehalococcoidia bacterium]|nr:uracil-DNA glycosylase [Dehalococcoidia bacterium]
MTITNTDATMPVTSGNPFSALRREIRACTRCELRAKCRGTVPGEGNQDARIVIVGEGPGVNEDLEGRPF